MQANISEKPADTSVRTSEKDRSSTGSPSQFRDRMRTQQDRSPLVAGPPSWAGVAAEKLKNDEGEDTLALQAKLPHSLYSMYLDLD